MAYLYPYGDTQQLNLDWLIEQWNEVKSQIDGSLQAEIDRVEAAITDLLTARDEAVAAQTAAQASAQAAAGSASTASGAASTATAQAQASAASAATAGAHASDAQGYAATAQQEALAAHNDAASAATSSSQAAASASDAHADALQAQSSAATASIQAASATNYAIDSEAWAVGERGGTPVASGDDTYENNSKYYADQAATVAASIPADYTELSDDVSELKTALNGGSKSVTTTVATTWVDTPMEIVKGYDYKLIGTAPFAFRTLANGTNVDTANSIEANVEYTFTASGNADTFRVRTNVGTGTITITQLSSIRGDIEDLKESTNALENLTEDISGDFQNYNNLYDKATSTLGYRLNASGEPVAVTGSTPNCFVSDYIPLTNGATYTRLYSGDAYHRTSFYDSSKVNKANITDASYTNTSNYAYARICGYAEEVSLEQFVQFTDVKTALDKELREKVGYEDNTVDLIVFAGQSNMAGRGATSVAHPETAPEIIYGAGYEFRAISDPTKLYPMTEPFGVAEDNPEGIDDDGKKTGSMVVAFTNAYYLHNGRIPVVGVSASQGDTYAEAWIDSLLTDLVARFNAAVTYLNTNGYTIRHKYCLWCQGEADGGGGQSTHDAYKGRAETIFNTLLTAGIETVFMVRIGHMNEEGCETKFDSVITDQTDIAKTMPNVVMASTDFTSMKDRGLMKDSFHYYQAGYNEIGTYSGINVALYERTGKEPTMYDSFTDDLYYSEKN